MVLVPKSAWDGIRDVLERVDMKDTRKRISGNTTGSDAIEVPHGWIAEDAGNWGKFLPFPNVRMSKFVFFLHPIKKIRCDACIHLAFAIARCARLRRSLFRKQYYNARYTIFRYYIIVCIDTIVRGVHFLRIRYGSALSTIVHYDRVCNFAHISVNIYFLRSK